MTSGYFLVTLPPSLCGPQYYSHHWPSECECHDHSHCDSVMPPPPPPPLSDLSPAHVQLISGICGKKTITKYLHSDMAALFKQRSCTFISVVQCFSYTSTVSWTPSTFFNTSTGPEGTPKIPMACTYLRKPLQPNRILPNVFLPLEPLLTETACKWRWGQNSSWRHSGLFYNFFFFFSSLSTLVL